MTGKPFRAKDFDAPKPQTQTPPQPAERPIALPAETLAAETLAANGRTANALLKTSDFSAIKPHVTQTWNNGGAQGRAEVLNLAQQIKDRNPAIGAKFESDMGVNAKPNPFDAPRMDESGNWFNGNGKRIPDPGRNPNVLLASDQQDSLSKHSLPQRPMETVEIRNDEAGHGYYGAGRDGGRKHKGVDILAEPGSSVRSPIEGRIEIRKTYLPKIDPYNGKYTNVWIVDKDGNEYGLGYVTPKDVNGQLIVRNGQRVKAGDVVGVVQNRAGEDKKGVMKNHIHFMQKNKDKSLIDPTETVNGWLKKPQK